MRQAASSMKSDLLRPSFSAAWSIRSRCRVLARMLIDTVSLACIYSLIATRFIHKRSTFLYRTVLLRPPGMDLAHDQLRRVYKSTLTVYRYVVEVPRPALGDSVSPWSRSSAGDANLLRCAAWPRTLTMNELPSCVDLANKPAMIGIWPPRSPITNKLAASCEVRQTG